MAVRGRLALALVDTPEFQRLRRIRQLGLAAGTYPGAEHTRFGHCLGALHVLERIRERLAAEEAATADWEAARAAALLHDVGHGPLSHLWERLTSIPHERWTEAIVAADTAVHAVLRAADPVLPERVLRLLRRHRDAGFLCELLSGQLDVDRMDYLLRDAIFTGASYGRFDLPRLVHALSVVGGGVAVHHRGLANVEEYLLARYFMYWRVYFHKTVRAAEATLVLTWERARHLVAAGRAPVTPPALVPFLRGEEVSLGSFLDADDGDLLSALKAWRREADTVLADLAARVLDRRYLKPVLPEPVATLPPGAVAAAREALGQAGFPAYWYLAVDSASLVPYDLYRPRTGEAGAGGASPSPSPILVLCPDGSLREVSELSPLVARLAELASPAVQVYAPAEARERVAAALASLGVGIRVEGRRSTGADGSGTGGVEGYSHL